MLSRRQVDYCNNFIKFNGNDAKIAEAMGLKENTVRTHKNDVYNKLLVNSKTELMHYLLTNMGWNNPKGLSKKNLFKITRADNGKYNLYIDNMQKFIKYILQFGGD